MIRCGRARGSEFLEPGGLLGAPKHPTRPSPWPSFPRAHPKPPCLSCVTKLSCSNPFVSKLLRELNLRLCYSTMLLSEPRVHVLPITFG